MAEQQPVCGKAKLRLRQLLANRDLSSPVPEGANVNCTMPSCLGEVMLCPQTLFPDSLAPMLVHNGVPTDQPCPEEQQVIPGIEENLIRAVEEAIQRPEGQ